MFWFTNIFAKKRQYTDCPMCYNATGAIYSVDGQSRPRNEVIDDERNKHNSVTANRSSVTDKKVIRP
ncbi:hypothetical protein GCM10008919_20870 [Selenomonas dianae]|uniref:Uncharacterized protein n=1 Tax=Selenomonas dianae TaxID=135079 RepID=A0ABN0TBJ7_9FIRM